MAESILNQSGIYCIRNIVNDKRYVGSAVNLRERKRNHFIKLRNGNHHSIKLQSSWDKHGECVFIFEILELVDDRKMLLNAEQRWIDFYVSHGANGYNILPIAGSRLGVKNSPESIAKTAAANRGRKMSPENKALLIASRKGAKATDETRKKLSDSHKGKKLPLEQRAKIAKAGIGKRHSTETIEAIRKRMLGNKYMVGRKHKLGIKASKETRAKMSMAHKAIWAKRKMEASNGGA